MAKQSQQTPPASDAPVAPEAPAVVYPVVETYEVNGRIKTRVTYADGTVVDHH